MKYHDYLLGPPSEEDIERVLLSDIREKIIAEKASLIPTEDNIFYIYESNLLKNNKRLHEVNLFFSFFSKLNNLTKRIILLIKEKARILSKSENIEQVEYFSFPLKEKPFKEADRKRNQKLTEFKEISTKQKDCLYQEIKNTIPHEDFDYINFSYVKDIEHQEYLDYLNNKQKWINNLIGSNNETLSKILYITFTIILVMIIGTFLHNVITSKARKISDKILREPEEVLTPSHDTYPHDILTKTELSKE